MHSMMLDMGDGMMKNDDRSIHTFSSYDYALLYSMPREIRSPVEKVGGFISGFHFFRHVLEFNGWSFDSESLDDFDFLKGLD